MVAMEKSILRQYQEYSRYLRPFRNVTFTDREMLSTMLQYVEPDDVASITQLLGERRGVIRITLKTNSGVQRLEESTRQGRLLIKGITLGLVEENGHYSIVTLDNVPNFISEEQVEEAMSQYGVIAGVLRDHVEYRGKKIETEKRRVLYTHLNNPEALPKEVEICGISVFVRSNSYHGQAQDDLGVSRGSHSRRSLESLHSRDADAPETPVRDSKGSSGRRTPLENGDGKGKKVLRANALNLLNNQLGSNN